VPQGSVALCRADEIYQRVTTFMGDRPLVIRTFDIGAEKVPEGLRDELAANPALGLRGLRRQILRYPEELRTQIRAILRGTVGGNAAILFPMVTNAEDLRVVLEHIDAVRSRLAREGVPHNQAIKLASMIEVPAAALNVRRIAELVDFVAIGTNDMSQYLTAADRDNADVSAYLDPATSGIFAIVAHIMREMESLGRGRDVMIAGELASDPRVACRFVLGGVRSLIINPPMATPLRDAIAGLRCRQ
jgi:phosphotransferase system enzyme I (PtsI)